LRDVAAGLVDGSLVAGAGALAALVARPSSLAALFPLADRARFGFVAAPPVAADLGRARDAPLV
jgi:hypothetical protein